MSEDNSGSAQTPPISDPNVTPPIDPATDDYKKDMFKYKTKSRELQERLDTIELEKEEAKGNLQNVIAKLKNDNKNLKGEVASSKISYAQGRIEEAIKTEAMKRGCKDADTFYKLIDRTDIDTVELDGKFNASKDDITGILDSYSKKLEHLGFFSKTVKIVDGVPKEITQTKKTKALENMTHEELMKVAEQSGMKRIV